MRDLENVQLRGCIDAFADAMRSMRRKLAQAAKLHYRYQKERWFLHAAEVYCAAVNDLKEGISRVELTSRGLAAFRDYLEAYAASSHFGALVAETSKTAEDLAAVQYTFLAKGNGFKVRRYEAERDYGAEIKETFRKFQQSAAKGYRVEFLEHADMNHIEAQVLDFVALLHPEAFSALSGFVARNQAYADPTISAFDREIQFYVAYLAYIDPLKQAGLDLCYPAVSATDKDVCAENGFDLALAAKLLAAGTRVVCNDFALRGRERILVVSGPNQGGKTTFARTFGQVHYLASLGCPVPGRSARLFLPDRMFTHFERAESIETLRGKLQDDLVRIHDILQRATPRSVVVMNEIFSSTTLADAVFLARKVMGRLIQLDALGVCVTFLDELATLGEQTVSLVSTVVPGDPAARTFKVVRRPADGRAYAVSLAEKHGLTYERLLARMRPASP
jgi:DNA mismatch repair ATPase MutS